ncbi:MAG: hypothetical protein HFF50_05885 [Lawsonibacter sp.]|nr:hypothetical protein [Lawsonibacter sp.]
MLDSNNYKEYFDFDETYFPCIDDAAIDAGARWETTYPHTTFLEMLTEMEHALSRQNGGRTLWIEGPYGVGKSQCAFALRKLLEVPEEEFYAYWDRYDALKSKVDLREKLIGHKRKGIVVAHRYAAGGIMSPRDFFFAVQESVKEALVRQNIPYLGENTLKESIITWLEDSDHKLMMNSLLQNPDKEWRALFAQSNADEILNKLRKGGEVKNLVEHIFRLANKEGITALTIDSDRLITWLTDIIEQNDIKLVFIWDEFSDYFKNNRESLTEFQKIISLVQSKPFYFIVIAHEMGHGFSENDKEWKKLRDRFVRIEILLPDNIAFDLIGHAFKEKEAAKQDWNVLADDLNERVKNARTQVMNAAKITDPQVIKNIMPLHPMAAFLLKNIAAAFKSNQRSMFDFIKSSNADDVQAFQWFIEHTGPFDAHPLLTVDMLWNFFYEKGRDDLTPDIRLILDTYPQQQNLREDEKAVLKAVLIMQAIDQRLGGTVDLLKPSGQNLSYVFEGIPNLEGSTKAENIAKGLKNRGILVSNPLGGGRYTYAAAILAGDQAKIDRHKKDVRENCTTAKLVTEGGLASVLPLTAPLRLRFETEPGTGKITPVTIIDFTRTINSLCEKPSVWHFHAVIAFAKDEDEASSFRKMVKAAAAEERYRDILFLDALSTPLGTSAFEQYVDFSAMALYYQGNQNEPSRERADKAKHVLDQDWKNRIYNGAFIVYTYDNPEGEKLGNAQGVASILQTRVTKKFCYAFDFARGLSENQLKITPALKQSAKAGILQSTSGVMVGIEKTLFPDVWNVENYWETSQMKSLPVSRIKVGVNQLIEAAFARDGQISIEEIYSFLEREYGFAPCNLSSFLTGFLLKEYRQDPFRYSDSSGGHEPMTPDKLAEMISNHIGKKPKPTYIVKMTADEMAFYDLTEKVWSIPANSCSSAGQAAIEVTKKMRGLNFPVWCLKNMDTSGAFEIVQKYIELVQTEGNTAHKKAIEIGEIARKNSSLGGRVAALVTSRNCQDGMWEYLRSFENGQVLELASFIGVEDSVLADIRRIFSIKHSCLWDKQTGEEEIRKLMAEYQVVKDSNLILAAQTHSLHEAYQEWRERLRFIGISWEELRQQYPSLAAVLNTLLTLYKQTDILPEQVQTLHEDLLAHGGEIRALMEDQQMFGRVYQPYLEALSPDDIAVIKTRVGMGLFELPKTVCNQKVKTAAEEFRKEQLKSQLFSLWREKTNTKDPREWSSRYRTPILCIVPPGEFQQAKMAFDTLNRIGSTDDEAVRSALEYLQRTNLFEALSDPAKHTEAFKRDMIGIYVPVLSDLNQVRDALERLPVDAYDWRDHPSVKAKIQQLADAEYNAGGSDRVLLKIDKMDDAQLKQYLKRLIKDSITVGMEILGNEG